MIDPRYSGDASKDFWELVNLVDDDKHTLYGLGCKLQNLEGQILDMLDRRCRMVEKMVQPLPVEEGKGEGGKHGTR